LCLLFLKDRDAAVKRRRLHNFSNEMEILEYFLLSRGGNVVSVSDFATEDAFSPPSMFEIMRIFITSAKKVKENLTPQNYNCL
jgi:hypothetical protein